MKWKPKGRSNGGVSPVQNVPQEWQQELLSHYTRCDRMGEIQARPCKIIQSGQQTPRNLTYSSWKIACPLYLTISYKPAINHWNYSNQWTFGQKCSIIKIGPIKVKGHLQFIIHELKYLPIFVSVVKVCNIGVSWASSCSLILQISIWEPSKHWNIWQTALEVIKQLKPPFSLWSKQDAVFWLSWSSWEIFWS